MSKLLQTATVVAGLLFVSTYAEAQIAKSSKCLKCHADESGTMKFEDKGKNVDVSIFVDESRFRHSIHGELQCAECHVDIDVKAHQEGTLRNRREYSKVMAELCRRCHLEVSKHFSDDSHSRKLGGAAACQDCHDPHYTSDPKSPREKISHTCEKCHPETYAKYARSVHGSALLRRNPDVPVCTDCHKAHSIKEARSAFFYMTSIDICWGCHGDERMMAKYKISTAVMKNFVEDFHAKDLLQRRKEGKPPVVDLCIRCHGVHEIARMGSPEAAAWLENLPKVCDECHKGVSKKFSEAWLSHETPSMKQAPLVFIIRLSYWIFIPFVILGLLVHIIFDVIHLRRRVRSGQVLVPANPGPSYVRFNVMRRMEHALVLVTFTMLLITGLPQKFHDSAWAEWIVDVFGGIDIIRWIHRITGIVFSAQALFHLIVNVGGILTGKLRPDMLATKRDFPDTIQGIKHALGLPAEKPKGDRYDFRQKFEYWGMVIGGTVMIVTGFTLFQPEWFERFLPAVLIPAAKVAHSFEAMMALLVIIVWHFYCAHFKLEFFPADVTIFTGRISHHRMVEEHELELERWEAKEKEKKEKEGGKDVAPKPEPPSRLAGEESGAFP